MKRCKDIMTKNPRCLSPTDTMQEAARQMKDEDIGSILICDPKSKKLLGLVTDRDIAIKGVALGRGLVTTLDTIMTRDPICCPESEDADRAVKLMAEHQVRRLPVVDAEKRLVGILSQGDIATRMSEPTKTAEVVKEVSQPPTSTYRQEHAA